MAVSPGPGALSFREARAVIAREVDASHPSPDTETIDLESAGGRVLAQDIQADRDYPALDRSARDGFAVRAADLPGRLRVVGEVRAGGLFEGAVNVGEAVEIMTGAPVPSGADTILMVEHVRRDDGHITFENEAAKSQFINSRGGEAAAGELLLRAGKRLDYADLGLLAAVGCVAPNVFRIPRVAIIATGDELVDPSVVPEPCQIRNSNAYSLAGQVRRAGGWPMILAVAPDSLETTRARIEQGLAADLLLLSGGVSAGKYDVVEEALKSLDAEFYFDRVAVQPGQPLVFGRARGRFFFGLPGNPASTMVTFEMFARLALEMLGGQPVRDPIFLDARLTQEFRHRPGLTRFLPAIVSPGGDLTPVAWTGSSDIAALTRANAFMMVDPDRANFPAGHAMPVFLK